MELSYRKNGQWYEIPRTNCNVYTVQNRYARSISHPDEKSYGGSDICTEYISMGELELHHGYEADKIRVEITLDPTS